MASIDEGRVLIEGVSLAELDKERGWSDCNISLRSNQFFYGTICDHVLASTGLSKDVLLDISVSESSLIRV